MSITSIPEFSEEAFQSFASEDSKNIQKLFEAAGLEIDFPSSDDLNRLTRRILGMVGNPDEAQDGRLLAFSLAQMCVQNMGVNPLASITLAQDVAAPPTCLEIGRQFRSEGIYIARREFKDLDGKSLGDYYCFAAPNNLEGSQTFNETLNHISGLKIWHGHDGFKVENPRNYIREWIAGLKSGAAEGKWSIPMTENAKKLYALMDKGDLRNTFKTSGPAYTRWLWSISLPHGLLSAKIVDFSDGLDDWDYNITCRACCRPVRVIKVNRLIL